VQAVQYDPKLMQHSPHARHTHIQYMMLEQKTNSGPQQISCSSYITVATNSYNTHLVFFVCIRYVTTKPNNHTGTEQHTVFRKNILSTSMFGDNWMHNHQSSKTQTMSLTDNSTQHKAILNILPHVQQCTNYTIHMNCNKYTTSSAPTGCSSPSN
jgi:hypothetical protein